MWKDDSVAWYLEVLMDSSTPTQKENVQLHFLFGDLEEAGKIHFSMLSFNSSFTL